MATFYAYCQNKTLQDRNGGSLVLWHIGHALEKLGHKFGGMLNIEDSPPADADFLMFQGEWWRALKPHIHETQAKWICWVGHFLPAVKYDMPMLSEIDADYFFTQYEGKAFNYAKEMIERSGKTLYYMPHAGCEQCNKEGLLIDCPEVLFIGNHFPERDEEWLNYAGVEFIGVPFEDIPNYYRSAKVCPNIHGDFQKNKPCEFAQVEGYMINERIFQVILSGGFAISDNNPIVKSFFSEDEVPYAETKEEFKRLIEFFRKNPDARLPYMKKAKERILKEHLYTHRVSKFLKQIGL
jgi:hypothetical protein